MMNFQALGIDISKNKFDCALIRDIGSGKIKTKALPNRLEGFNQLTEWLYKNIGEDLSLLKVFMEATGVYHQALAEHLHEKGIAVYLLNPADSAHYAKYDSLHKTDKSDSQSLARAGIDRILNKKARQWQPAPAHIKHLNALLARLDALEGDLQRENNRMEKAEFGRAPKEVIQSISSMQAGLQQQISTLKQEIEQHIDQHPDLKKDRALLRSIPGVGEVISLRMMALYHSKEFASASQMAAYLGLVPRKRDSGKHKGKAMLSKRGNSTIRAKLYLAAVVAKKWNPDINAHYHRLKARHKTEMQTIGAAMRRLVQICFGVLKNQCEYQAKITIAA